MKRILGLVLALMLFLPFNAAKATDYVNMNFDAIMKLLIRFGAVNINSDDIIDAYTMATECELYKRFYMDDFKWQKIRKAMRQKIKNEINLYPTSFRYDTKLQLDRYNFKEKLFKFSETAMIKNVNVFTITSKDMASCGNKNIPAFPRRYSAVVDHPLYMAGLPLTESDSDALLKRLVVNKNTDRIIYTRFNFRVAYIGPLQRDKNVTVAEYYQPSAGASARGVRIDVHLDSIEFFEDEDKTKLIYTYTE